MGMIIFMMMMIHHHYDNDDVMMVMMMIGAMMGMRELRLMMLSVVNSWPSCSNVNCNKDSDDFDNHCHL